MSFLNCNSCNKKCNSCDSCNSCNSCNLRNPCNTFDPCCVFPFYQQPISTGRILLSYSSSPLTSQIQTETNEDGDPTSFSYSVLGCNSVQNLVEPSDSDELSGINASLPYLMPRNGNITNINFVFVTTGNVTATNGEKITVAVGIYVENTPGSGTYSGFVSDGIYDTFTVGVSANIPAGTTFSSNLQLPSLPVVQGAKLIFVLGVTTNAGSVTRRLTGYASGSVTIV